MPSVGLVLAIGLSFGLASESCNVSGTDFTIDDFSDHVAVTNASAAQVAELTVSTSLSSFNIELAPGESGTLTGLAARSYTIEVYAPDDPSGMTYKQALVDMRDALVTLSLHPENPSVDVASALLELSTVEAALQQMHGSRDVQSCSATIKTGVDGKVTVSWNPSGLGSTGAWSLSCR